MVAKLSTIRRKIKNGDKPGFSERARAVNKGLLPSKTKKIAKVSNCPIIISGGVSSIADIKKAKKLKDKNVGGIIIGKAIYDGDIKLHELAKEMSI